MFMLMSLLICPHVPAADSPGRTATLRRQMSHCMSERMRADRSLWYNAAARLCRDELSISGGKFAANDPMKPADARVDAR
jgi:hypothetical protein